MNNKQLIAADLTKKQKAEEAQRRYRLRLKEGEPAKDGSKFTYDIYKKQNADYMKEYRLQKKIATIKAYTEENPEPPAKTQEKIAKVEKKYLSLSKEDLGEKANRLIYLFKQRKKILSNLLLIRKLRPSGKRIYQRMLPSLTKFLLVVIRNQQELLW